MSALHVACILEQETYKPGDQAPEGYLAWHEWAEVQHKAGLRQKQCGRCGLWRYPQQLSATVDRTEVTGLRKRQPFRRTLETPVCNDCNKTPNAALTGAQRPPGEAAMTDTTTEHSGPLPAVGAPVERPVRQQPRLTVRLASFPESNGKRNWTALLVRVDEWGGLIGNCGGITVAHGELWNRVAYHAECAKLLIGERDTEPHILDYGDDIHTPDEWAGEVRGGRHAA